MTATAHALVGGAIAASVPNPLIGISLAIISHPLLDLVPHWDSGVNWRTKSTHRFFREAVTDAAIGLSVSYWLFGRQSDLWYFLAAVAAAELSDILTMPYLLLNWRFPPFSWIYQFQSRVQINVGLPWGIITQIIVVGIIILLLKVLF